MTVKVFFSYIIQVTSMKCVEDTTVSHHEDIIWRRWQRIPKGRGVRRKIIVIMEAGLRRCGLQKSQVFLLFLLIQGIIPYSVI